MKSTLENKVCILAAGRGSRCDVTSGLHKALLPINNRPMISHIFDCIPSSFGIVIAIGHNSEQLRTYIDNVHGGREITFVEVDNYDGPGSGPGLSLLQCRGNLQCPFIFMPVDTYTPGNVFGKIDKNWVGAVKPTIEDSALYCMISGDEHVDEIGYHDGEYIFNGIAGVLDYKEFWKNLSNKNLIKNEHQVINGLKDLGNLNVNVFDNFYDTGNTKSYLKVRSLLSNEIVLPKTSECIYIDNGKVVKYFSDREKLTLRVRRANSLSKFVPGVNKINDNMYIYDYIDATLLSNVTSEEVLDNFLIFLSKDFHDKQLDRDEEFLSNCKAMYFDKTSKRADMFAGGELDAISIINGVRVLSIKDILSQVQWDDILDKAIATNIHGDLQPENILFKDKFILIDWRESFGSSISCGDLYYDLSKLYHALLINGTYVLNNNYSVLIDKNEASLTYSIKSNLLVLLDKLERFCVINNYDWKHVSLLGILHYINIAPFYRDYDDGRYSKFIFLLGKLLLTKHLRD
tara:strand:- start:27473 stop:29023 length:1551 start_codon:yes stop_codon:yes gene_type:complete